MLIDLHVKSDHTPGVKTSITDALKRAKEAKLDGVLFADKLASSHCHDILAQAKEIGIQAFIGVEIPTDKGHIIGVLPTIDSFYEEEEWKRLTNYATPTAESIIELFVQRGGAIIAARPYDRTLPYRMGDYIFLLDDIHAVEVINLGAKQLENDFALEAASFLGVNTAGGSDAQNGKSHIGRCATFFGSSVTTQEELVDALKTGEFWAVKLESPDAKPPQQSPRHNRNDKNDKNDNRRGNNNRNNRGGNRNNNRGGGNNRRGGRGNNNNNNNNNRNN